MIGKAIITSIISVIIFICLLTLLTQVLSPEEFSLGQLVQIFFYGSAIFIPFVFVILVLLNLLIKWKAKFTNRPNLVYFLYATVLALLPVLGFAIFDFSHRDRSFEERTFLGMSSKYSVTFVLALIAILLNRKIVWNNFKKPVA